MEGNSNVEVCFLGDLFPLSPTQGLTEAHSEYSCGLNEVS